MVDPEARAAAFAWFDRADVLWLKLKHARTDEEFRAIAREQADATMMGLKLLEQSGRPSDPTERVVVGLA
jgi:hypothetical protein